MTSQQPARNIQLVSRDGGFAQPARIIQLTPYVDVSGPEVPTIPVVTLIGGGGGTRIGWNDAPQRDSTAGGGWNDAPEIARSVVIRFEADEIRDATKAGVWSPFDSLEVAVKAPWDSFGSTPDNQHDLSYLAPPAMDRRYLSLWDDSVKQIDALAAYPYLQPPPNDRQSLYRFWRVDDYSAPHTQWLTNTYVAPEAFDSHDDEGRRRKSVLISPDLSSGYASPDKAAAAFYFGQKAPDGFYDRAVQPKDGGMVIPHSSPSKNESEIEVNWGLGSWERPDPGTYINWYAEQGNDHPVPPAPPVLEVYLFMPHISITTVPDGQEVIASSATISLDRDTWAWRIKATLADQAALNLVRPDSNGPKDIQITINGYVWTGFVESYERSRAHGSRGWNISARSHSAVLAAPYAPKKSQVITADYTAAQLADMAVANTGWTVSWQAPDWVVAGGAWAFQDLDPMGQLNKLAAAVGARVRPHRELKLLEVISMYPHSPHLWDAAPLDAILPSSLILDLGGRWQAGPSYNRAIVAGNSAGGVLVNATRSGTAGDTMAPQIVDPLITSSIVGQERARVEMDLGGSREMVSITTMLGENGDQTGPALMLPQHLIEVQEIGDSWRGQVGSLVISAARGSDTLKVRQQIEVERG